MNPLTFTYPVSGFSCCRKERLFTSGERSLFSFASDPAKQEQGAMLFCVVLSTSIITTQHWGSLHHPAAWAKDGLGAAAPKLYKCILAPGIIPNPVFASQCASGTRICLTCQSRNEGGQKFSIYWTSVPKPQLESFMGMLFLTALSQTMRRMWEPVLLSPVLCLF